MSMNYQTYQREIMGFLHAGYEIDGRIEGGGKHPMLVMQRRSGGPRITVTFPNTNPPGGSWDRAWENKRKELVKLLGKPLPPPPPRPRAKMEDLMPTAALADQLRDRLPSLAAQLAPLTSYPTPATTFEGRISLNRNATQTVLSFYVPSDLAARFSGHGMDAERSDAGWVLRVDDTPTASGRGRVSTPRARLRTMANSPWRVLTLSVGGRPGLTDGRDLFYSTPATFALRDDGTVFAELAASPRPVMTRRKRAVGVGEPVEGLSVALTRMEAAEVQAASSPAKEDQTSAAAPPFVEDVVELARSCLRLLRRVEATSEYRLARLKDDGGWAFVSRIE
jgi:hypothetical protein